jgi:hypothetical protein
MEYGGKAKSCSSDIFFKDQELKSREDIVAISNIESRKYWDYFKYWNYSSYVSVRLIDFCDQTLKF